MLELFGQKIDPGATYLIYFSGEERKTSLLSKSAIERYEQTMQLVYRAPHAVASRLLASIPLDEIPHTINLNGLLTIDFVQDRKLIPLFDANFGSGRDIDRKIMVMTSIAYGRLKAYERRMRDRSGRGSKYFY